jgi:hypothetical protein
MQAQRARCRKAVDSYEGECSLVSLLICADELSLHKTSVRMEAIHGFCAGLGVGACSAEHEIDLPYKAAEIRYWRGIPSFRMSAQWIG